MRTFRIPEYLGKNKGLNFSNSNGNVKRKMREKTHLQRALLWITSIRYSQ